MSLLSPPQNPPSRSALGAGPAGDLQPCGGRLPWSGDLRFGHRILRRAVFHRLKQIRHGRVELAEGKTRHAFGDGGPSALRAQVRVKDPRFYRYVALGGNLGGAEAFIRGYWDCDDLVSLVRIFCRNPGVSRSGDRGLARLALPLRRAARWLQRNSIRGSRRNIAAHYDLGNEFFEQFLDETMAYSCGIFERPESTLEEAAIAKYDRICRKLELGPRDHVLEIGCGWGGFAIYAAREFGCRVTATTISRRQHELASQRAQEAGLQGRVTLLSEDYRQLHGVYDKLVSVEMIEAVGARYFDTYFRACCNLLKPDGMMLLQAITIADQSYEAYRRSVDFIQRYVFPGGLLPSIEAICRSVARSSDFRIFHLEELTPHYAQTLAHWRRRFHANMARIRELDLPEDLPRIWEFYFCYCEGGFRERAIGDVQMVLTKPQCRRGPVIQPLTN